MHAKYLAAPLLAATLLAACTQQAAPVLGPRNPVYSTDLRGKAAVCTAPDVAITEGKSATATIATGGGGWCGVNVTMGGNPLTAGLLTQAPKNGKVYIHTVGDATRVDYTPAGAGVTGDAFTVTFIPGNETMQVTVTGAAK
jgi:hypothetical protein